MFLIVSVFALLFLSYFSPSCHFWFFSTSSQWGLCFLKIFFLINFFQCSFFSHFLQPLWSALRLHRRLMEKGFPAAKGRWRASPCRHPPTLLPGPITALHLFSVRPLFLQRPIWIETMPSSQPLLWTLTSSDSLFPRSSNNCSQLLGAWPIFSIADAPSPVIPDLCSQTFSRIDFSHSSLHSFSQNSSLTRFPKGIWAQRSFLLCLCF